MKRVPYSIKMPAALLEELRESAHVAGESTSEWIRYLLRYGLDCHPRYNTRRQPRENNHATDTP